MKINFVVRHTEETGILSFVEGNDDTIISSKHSFDTRQLTQAQRASVALYVNPVYRECDLTVWLDHADLLPKNINVMMAAQEFDLLVNHMKRQFSDSLTVPLRCQGILTPEQHANNKAAVNEIISHLPPHRVPGALRELARSLS